MSHRRQSSLDLHGTTTGSSSSHRNTSHVGTGSTTPRNTTHAGGSSHGGTRPDGPDDAMNAVYKAIAENTDFINRVADALRANPGGLRGPRGQTGAPGSVGTAEQGHWRADEVGFFFPDLDIVTIGKDSFYRNASVFLNRLDDVVKLHGGDVVRNNIPTCLRGAALQWYTTEVTDIEKASFRSPSNTNPQDSIYRWRQALKRRWDPPASVALQNFMNTNGSGSEPGCPSLRRNQPPCSAQTYRRRT